MLKLNDPLWAQLNTAFGSGEEVAELLQQVYQNPADDELRQELFELLLHQDTIYAATLAAVPHLVYIAENTLDRTIFTDLYITCGWIEASREHSEEADYFGEFHRERQPKLDKNAIHVITSAYLASLVQMSRLYPRVADKDQMGELHLDATYLLAAHAAYTGRIKQARLLFHHPDGEEYTGACPFCKVDWYIWSEHKELSDSLIIYTQDPVTCALENNTSSSIEPAAYIELIPELQTLMKEAEHIGAHHLAVCIPSLGGQAVCPECSEKVSVWAALTD